MIVVDGAGLQLIYLHGSGLDTSGPDMPDLDMIGLQTTDFHSVDLGRAPAPALEAG
jgi:hypothetical protein